MCLRAAAMHAGGIRRRPVSLSAQTVKTGPLPSPPLSPQRQPVLPVPPLHHQMLHDAERKSAEKERAKRLFSKLLKKRLSSGTTTVSTHSIDADETVNSMVSTSGSDRDLREQRHQGDSQDAGREVQDLSPAQLGELAHIRHMLEAHAKSWAFYKKLEQDFLQ